jgi:hypothetical protein
MPAHAPSGWEEAVAECAALERLPTAEFVQNPGSSPAESMSATTGLDPGAVPADTAELLRRVEFLGRWYWITVSQPAVFRTWWNWICEVNRHLAGVDLVDRIRILLVAQGEAADCPECRSDSFTRVLSWPERVDVPTIRFYAHTRVANLPGMAWEIRLAGSVLASLAQWDPEVCDVGSMQSLRDMLEPDAWLRSLALRRGWKADARAEAGGLWLGTHQPAGRTWAPHSSIAVLAGQQEVISRRIWEGQVEALYPLLERWRQNFIAKYRHVFVLPWQGAFGLLEDALELEFSDIAAQLRLSLAGTSREAIEICFWLRDVRNHLAHFEAVPARLLLDPRACDMLRRSKLAD